MEKHNYYLVLNCKGGGLIIENVSAPDYLKQKYGKEYYIVRGPNLNNPIPYTTVANIFASLTTTHTVRTNPKRRGKIYNCKDLDSFFTDSAKKSEYHISSYFDPHDFVEQVIGKDGFFYSIFKKPVFLGKKCILKGNEFFNSNKTAFDSNVNGNMVDLGHPEGPCNGVYNWYMLKRCFGYDTQNPTYQKLMDFIKELLGIDNAQKCTFKDTVAKIREVKDEKTSVKIKEFVKSIKNDWPKYGSFNPWMYAIFGFYDGPRPSSTPNTQCCPKITNINPTGLLYKRGADHRRVNIDATIIIPFNDEHYKEQIVRRFATFLDGGVCEAKLYYEYGKIPNVYDYEWEKISDKEPFETID